MKVKIKDLEFNPFRGKDTPINKEIIKSLKDSIEQDGFWGSLPARPHPEIKGKYQIACGHHRLTALQECMKPTDEIAIEVENIDDFRMVRIMANENKDDYDGNPEIIRQTVRDTRDFLKIELGKYNTWEEFKKSELDKSIQFNNAQTFESARGEKGIGWSIIWRFLNYGLPDKSGRGWKEAKIKQALSDIDDREVDREALKIFEREHTGRSFKIAVKNENKKRKTDKKKPLSKKEILELAEKVKKRISPDKSGKKKKISSGSGKSYQTAIATIVDQELNNKDEFESKLNDIILDLKNIDKDTEHLGKIIGEFNSKLHEMGVQEIKTLSSIIIINNFFNLLTNINVLASYLGINFNNKNQSYGNNL